MTQGTRVVIVDAASPYYGQTGKVVKALPYERLLIWLPETHSFPRPFHVDCVKVEP